MAKKDPFKLAFGSKMLGPQLDKFNQGLIDAPDLSDLLRGGVLPLQSAKLAMFKGSEPVDELTYVNLIMKAYENGKIPVEEGIYMQEINKLKKEDKVKYEKWLKSGYKPTSFKGGANSLLNKEIQARGGLELSGYDRKYSFHESRGTLIFEATPVTITPSNQRQIFENSVRGKARNGPLNIVGGKGTTFAVHIVDGQGRATILESNVREQDNELVFTQGKSQDYAPFPITPYPQPTGKEVLGIAAEGDVGHVQAESTQEIKASADRLQKAIDIEKKSDAPRERVLSYLQKLHQDVMEVYKAATINDKIFFKTPIPTDSAELKTAFAIVQEQARILGHNQVLVIEESSGGKFTTKVIEVPFGYSADFAVSEFRRPNQNWKGPRSAALKSSVLKLLKGIAEARVAGNLTDTRSSSILTRGLLLSLDRTFNTKDFSSKIKKSSGKKKKQVAVKNKSRRRKNTTRLNQTEKKLSSRVASERKKIRQGVKSTPIVYTKMSDRRSRQGAKVNLVDAINMDLYDAVVDQMVQPSLVNRTGRFARSVKVTLAEQNAIFYVYQRAPYSVFSVQEGRSPWATRYRDPHRIISSAIQDVVLSKYAGYFKQPLRIVGA